MALTDIQVKTAKPKDKAYKLSDAGGLHLFVTAAGGKLWRLKYAKTTFHKVSRSLLNQPRSRQDHVLRRPLNQPKCWFFIAYIKL